MIRNLCFVIIIFLLPCKVYCQQYSITHYDINDGLPNNTIRSISQDRLGLIYIGTNNGASIYDGTVFRRLDMPGFGNQRPVYPISRLKGDKLFLSYAGNTHYYYFSNGALVNPRIKLMGVIERVFDSIMPYSLICSNQGLFRLENDSLIAIKLGLKKSEKMVSNLLSLDGEKMLLARKGYSMAIISKRNFSILNETEETFFVNDMIRDKAGNIWLATETRGLMLLDNIALAKNKIEFKKLPPQLGFLSDKKEAIYSLQIDKRDSSLLIGSADYGMVVYKPNAEVIKIGRTNGLSSNQVNCIYIDKDNIIWTGTNLGIDKIVNKDVVIYGRTFDSNAERIVTIHKDPKSRIWFFKNDFMYYFEGNEVKKLPYPAGAEKIVLSSANSGNGFWLALPQQLTYVDCSANIPVIKKTIKTAILYPRIYQWNNGAIILGSDSHLAVLENNHITILSDSVKMIRSFLKDRYGKLWIGSFDYGLYRFDIKKNNGLWRAEQLYRYYDGNKSYNRFLMLVEDKNDYILGVNKFSGIYIFGNNDRRSALLTRVRQEDGLDNNDVTALFQKEDDTIWYGTISGLNSLRLQNGTWISKNVSNNYNVFNSVTRIDFSNGYLWAATDVGLYRIKLSAPIQYNVPVYFKEVVFLNNVIKLFTRDTAIQLKSNQNTFAVNFTAPFFINEHQTKYYYRLISSNDSAQWNKISGNKSINFSSLNHGRYLLQLKAVAFNDIPNEMVSTLMFYIKKPFYLQSWFIAACLAISFIFLYFIYIYRIKQIKKIYAVRNNISKNLHDEIGATLSSINIYSELARQKTEKNTDASSLLNRIYSGSQQALESINDIVWFVNPQNDNCETISIKMQDFAIPLLDAKRIETVFDIDEKILHLRMPMQERQNIYLIFKEAVNNIAKYSGAKKAAIKMLKNGSYLVLKIEDDGKGFNPSDVKNGNGLKNMLHRAATIKGICHINSSPGNGCKIELFYPIP